MFDNISPRYDLLNIVLSLGMCIYWRNRLIKSVLPLQQKTLLDVATGTADVAIAASRKHPLQITGTDISDEMMRIGREKIARQAPGASIELVNAPAEQLPFDDNKFDVVTVAYGVRNFERTEAGLREIYRVMKPGGKLAVLEFSKPKVFPVKQLFRIYFRWILPLLGRWVAKDAHAYTYLPESVQEFPEGEAFLRILQKQGYVNTQCKALTFGITSLYTAYKPS